MKNLGLGRLVVEDPRDQKFLMKGVIKKAPPTRTYKYWKSSDIWLDQGETSSCVGHGWAHFIEDGPIMHPEKGSHLDPFKIYNEAQKIDEWEGTDYDGTSVRAGAKVLQTLGYIGEYRWAFDLPTMVNALLMTSPVVIGVSWYTKMFEPDEKGIITIGGNNEGGHCVKVDGVNTKKKLFRIKNSWGKNWSPTKHCWLPFKDMEQLIVENAEICMAMEIHPPKKIIEKD